MIETKVPKDIRRYKTKLIGPFSTRQLICFAVAVVVDILVYLCILGPLELSLNTVIYVIIFLDIPIFAFIFEPMGVPMEIYLKNVMVKSFIYPAKRKVKTRLREENKNILSDKERKAKQKKYKAQLKSNPELKPFK